VLEIIATELREIREAYGDPRRTEIIPDTTEIAIEDLIADENMVITVSRGGYIKRSPLSMYRAQRRGGKGRIGMATKEEDIVEHLFVASTHAYVLVFTDRGRMYWLKVHQIPEVAANARGKAIVNLLPLEQNENVRALLTSRDFTEGKYVVMATRAGKIKKTELAAFSNVRAAGIIAIDIFEGDDLYAVRLSKGNDEIFVATHEGMAIRFPESHVRPMGRGAAGVKAISLKGDDSVIEMDVLPAGADAPPPPVDEEAGEEVVAEEMVAEEIVEETADVEGDEEAAPVADDRGYILTITEKGFGKRTPVTAYRLQRRGGLGLSNLKVTEKNGRVAGLAHVGEDEQILLITEQGMMIRTDVGSIRVAGRKTQGVRVINIDESDTVVAAVKLLDRDQPEEQLDETAAGEGTENPEGSDDAPASLDETPESPDEPVH
jgi:DNA gyrase subunit A